MVAKWLRAPPNSFFCYSKKLVHTVNTLLFLMDVWMNIQVERCCHIGMTEYRTYRLVIALALYATGCKGVAQPVEHDLRNAKPLQ